MTVSSYFELYIMLFFNSKSLDNRKLLNLYSVIAPSEEGIAYIISDRASGLRNQPDPFFVSAFCGEFIDLFRRNKKSDRAS